jgi:hypothetical protein
VLATARALARVRLLRPLDHSSPEPTPPTVVRARSLATITGAQRTLSRQFAPLSITDAFAHSFLASAAPLHARPLASSGGKGRAHHITRRAPNGRPNHPNRRPQFKLDLVSTAPPADSHPAFSKSPPPHISPVSAAPPVTAILTIYPSLCVGAEDSPHQGEAHEDEHIVPESPERRRTIPALPPVVPFR